MSAQEIGVGKGAELAAVHQRSDLGLHGFQRFGGKRLPGNGRVELRGLDRICLERGGHIHEIQRVQMIEMHHMVMQVLHAQHQIADGRGVSGDFHADGVFKGAGGGKGVGVGAYAAGALREMLRVTRVTALENHFQPAEQCGGAASVLDAAVFHFHLDTQMSFDAGDGIHHNGSRVGALGSLCLTHVCSLVFKNMFHSRPVRRMTPRPTDRGACGVSLN